MSSQGYFSMKIGLLYRKQVRQFLDDLKFKGDDIGYIEHKFFTYSLFNITGDYVK